MAGSWKATSSLRTAWALPIVAELPDGRVLVAGGSTDSGVTDSAEVYNPVSGSWKATGSITSPGSTPCSACGQRSRAGGRWLERPRRGPQRRGLRPVSGTWSSVDSMNVARRSTTAVAVSGGLLVAGGADAAGKAMASAEIFDASSESWHDTGSLGTPRAFAAIAPLGGGGAIPAGGMSDKGATKTAERFSDGKWTPVADVAEARAMDARGAVEGRTGVDRGRRPTARCSIRPRACGRARAGWPQCSPRRPRSDAPTGRCCSSGVWPRRHRDHRDRGLRPGHQHVAARAPDLLADDAATTTVVLPNGSVLLAGGASGTTPLAGAQVFGVPGAPAQRLRKTDEDSDERVRVRIGSRRCRGHHTARVRLR